MAVPTGAGGAGWRVCGAAKGVAVPEDSGSGLCCVPCSKDSTPLGSCVLAVSNAVRAGAWVGHSRRACIPQDKEQTSVVTSIMHIDHACGM